MAQLEVGNSGGHETSTTITPQRYYLKGTPRHLLTIVLPTKRKSCRIQHFENKGIRKIRRFNGA